MANKHQIKVVVAGKFSMKHRCGVIIRPLIYDFRDGGFQASFVTPWFKFGTGGSRSFLKRLARRVLIYLDRAIFFAELSAKAHGARWVVLLSTSNEYLSTVLFLKRFYKFELATDFYVGQALMYLDRTQGATKGDTRYRLFAQRDRMAIEQSDVLFFNNRAEYQMTCEELQIESGTNLCVLPQTCPDHGVANPAPSTAFRICWWGLISPLHGVDFILEALKAFNQRNIPFAFTFFVMTFPEREVEAFNAKVKAAFPEGHVSVRTDATFANGQLQKILTSDCDCALGHFGDASRKATTILPTKIIDAACLGLPTISRNTAAIEEFFGNSTADPSIMITELLPSSVANALETLAQSPDKRASLGATARRIWETHFRESAAEAVVKNRLLANR